MLKLFLISQLVDVKIEKEPKLPTKDFKTPSVLDSSDMFNRDNHKKVNSMFVSDKEFRYSSDSLNRLLKFYTKGKKAFSVDEDVGSIEWVLDKESKGFSVERYTFNNLYKIVSSYDMETGEVRDYKSDEMDVYVYVLKRNNVVEEVYVVEKVKHFYNDGSMSVDVGVVVYR